MALSLSWTSVQTAAGRQSQFGRCKWAFETAVHVLFVCEALGTGVSIF